MKGLGFLLMIVAVCYGVYGQALVDEGKDASGPIAVSGALLLAGLAVFVVGRFRD